MPAWCGTWAGLRSCRPGRCGASPGGETTARIYLAARHADVLEVLGRHDEFTVGGYGARMAATAGPFLLGFDFTLQYLHEIRLLRAALDP